MIEHRSVEIRIADDPERRGPGVLSGVLMPYETRAGDRPELFERGALYWDAAGVVLTEQHNREAPIMRFVPIAEDRAVRVEFPLPDTSRGRDAATMIRNGTLRGLSVEFRAERESVRDGVRVVKKARLTGAGLVDDPSYTAPVEVRHREARRRVWL